MSEHPTGLETRALPQGHQAVFHHGDGTCTKSWGVTEEQATESVREEVSGE